MWLTPFTWREFFLIGFLSYTMGWLVGHSLATVSGLGWWAWPVGIVMALVLLAGRELWHHRRRPGRHRLRMAEDEYLDWVATLCIRVDEERARQR